MRGRCLHLWGRVSCARGQATAGGRQEPRGRGTGTGRKAESPRSLWGERPHLDHDYISCWTSLEREFSFDISLSRQLVAASLDNVFVL